MPYTVRQIKIGGGGVIRGMDISDDGTILANPDTYDLFISDGSLPWRSILTTETLPPDVWTTQFATFRTGLTGQAPYEAVIHKTDSNRIYIMLDIYVYRSEDQGASFVQTNFPAGPTAMWDSSAYSNNPLSRGFNKRMALDPTNVNHLFIGRPTNGVEYTQDGGTTYTAVSTSTIPLSTNDSYGYQYPLLMAFDPNSASSGGRKQGIYVHSYGTGLFRSTNGGTSWAAVSGAPTTCCHLKVATNGYVYLITTTSGEGNGALWVYNGTSWSTPIASNVAGIALDPNTAGRVVVVNGNTDTRLSLDHGATWTTAVTHTFNSEHLAWKELTNLANPITYGGNIWFDPSEANMLYLGEGFGVSRGSPGAGAIHWEDFTIGIEELNTRQIIYPPGGNIVCSVWDQGVFRVTNPNTYSATKGTDPANSLGLRHGWGIDFCQGTPSFIVALLNAVTTAAGQCGYSQDGGATWTIWDPQPPNFGYDSKAAAGGNIAISTGTSVNAANANICVIATDYGNNPNQVTYTTDGGTTWQASSLPGIPTHGRTGWGNAYSAGTYALCSDRVTAGTFYAFNVSANVNVASGTYNSGTGEVTLTLVHPFGLTVGHSYDITIVTGTGAFASCNGVRVATAGTSGATLKYIIATGLTMTITAGAGGDQCYNLNARGVWKSTNNGASFTRVFNGNGNAGMDTGHYGGGRKIKAVPGNAGHLFFTMGQASQCPLMRSTDAGATWTQVAGMIECWDIGFGAVADGQTYPGIIVPGWRSGVWGWWYSADNCATWTQIATYPYNSYNIMFCVTGDPVIPGKFYLGQNSNGFLVLDPNPLMEFTMNWAS